MQLPGWAKPAAFVLIVLIGGTLLWWQMQRDDALVRVGDQRFGATVLRTVAQQEKGLSGTNSLPADQVMVFAFGSNGTWPMWMKDMKYPIDIVWLDSGRRVVHVVKGAQPASYPATKFASEKPSRYVLEFASGTVERAGIKQGDPIGLPMGI